MWVSKNAEFYAGFQKCPQQKLKAKNHEKMHKIENTQNSHSFLALAFFRGICLKVHKHEIFFLAFFAETETLWCQGPVTQEF